IAAHRRAAKAEPPTGEVPLSSDRGTARRVSITDRDPCLDRHRGRVEQHVMRDFDVAMLRITLQPEVLAGGLRKHRVGNDDKRDCDPDDSHAHLAHQRSLDDRSRMAYSAGKKAPSSDTPLGDDAARWISSNWWS